MQNNKNFKIIVILFFIISLILLGYLLTEKYHKKITLKKEKVTKNSKITQEKKLEKNTKIKNLANIKNNFYNNSEKTFINFKENNKKNDFSQNVFIEDNTPLFFRTGDRTKISAKIFNNTEKEIGFKIKFESEDIEVNKSEQNTIILAKSNKIVNFWIKSGINKDKNIKYIIYALGDSKKNSRIIQKTIEFKEFLESKTTYLNGGIAKLNKKQDFKIFIPKNTDVLKSKVKISFSNNLLEGINKIVKSLSKNSSSSSEQIINSIYPNSIILKYPKLFSGTIPKEKAQKEINSGIKKIASIQTKDGGFTYWKGEKKSDINITPYILRKLIEIRNNNIQIPEELINKSIQYLENNFSKIKSNLDKAEIFYTFSKIGKAKLAYEKLLKNTEKKDFSRHSLIVYTYGLINWDKIKNKEEIEKNIKTIFKKLETENSELIFWSKKSDKALFTSMLIDYGYEFKIIQKQIAELYNINWINNYNSAIEKNNVFIAFSKYRLKYSKNSSSKFAFSIGTIHNRDKRYFLGKNNPNTISREFVLDDVVQYKEDYIELTTYIISGKSLFTNLTLEIIPKDKLKINKSENGIKIEKKIYEILNENKIKECEKNYSLNIKNIKKECLNNLKEITDSKYILGKKYKIFIKLNFDSKNIKNYINLEDYIPSTFEIINIKNKKFGFWDHIEIKKDKIFVNTKHFLGNELNFNYIVSPKFPGTFIYPPAKASISYNGKINGHSKFKIIEVK